jgi:hypothetical protein
VRELFYFEGEGRRKGEGNDDKLDEGWKRNTREGRERVKNVKRLLGKAEGNDFPLSDLTGNVSDHY